MRMRVWSLASLSELGIQHCLNCGIGHRHGLDMALLWLWCRLAAVAPIQPLAWELPGPKKKKKKKAWGALLYLSSIHPSIYPSKMYRAFAMYQVLVLLQWKGEKNLLRDVQLSSEDRHWISTYREINGTRICVDIYVWEDGRGQSRLLVAN